MYGFCYVASLKALKDKEYAGEYQSSIKISDEWLLRIQEGLLASDRTPERCKRFYRENAPV
jgi:hypothetical protein